MAALEQRVAYIEGKVDEQSKIYVELRGDVRDLRGDLHRLEQRIDRLDDRVSRQFVWVVGIQITTTVAVLGAVLARS